MTSATPDYPDWTQGVGLLDQSSVLTNYGQTLTANGGGASFDTSRAASVFLNFTVPTSVSGRRFLLALTWSEGNVTTVREYITFHADTSYPFGLHDGTWSMPAKGSSLFVALLGDDNSTSTITLVASTRTLAKASLTWAGNRADRMLVNFPAVSVPASGSSSTIYVPPVLDSYLFDFVTGSSSTAMSILGVTYSNAALTVRGVGRLVGGALGSYAAPFPLPNTGLEVTLTNSTAGALSLGAVFWDVS